MKPPLLRSHSMFSMSRLLLADKQDSALGLAIVNGLSALLVIASVVIVAGVYFIFQPFVKPLLWALLVGSALHPMKQLVAAELRLKITRLESSSTPISLHVVCLPLSTVLRLCDSLGGFIVVHFHVFIKFFGGLCLLSGCYLYTPVFVVNLVGFIVRCVQFALDQTLNVFGSSISVLLLLLGFFSALMFLWDPENHKIFSYSFILVWVSATAWIANFFEGVRLPVFLVFQLSLVTTFFYCEFKYPGKEPNSEEKAGGDCLKNPPEEPQTSVFYIKWLAIICAVIRLITIPSAPYICMVMLSIYGLRQLCNYFGVVDAVQAQIGLCGRTVHNWYSERKTVLMSKPFECGVELIGYGRNWFLAFLKSSCDSAAAVLVILGLLVFSCFASVFFTVQAYRESVYLVQAGGSVINRTFVHNPELHQLLPEDWQSTMDTALNNAYIYAREWLSKLIRGMLNGRGIDDAKSEELEKGALELWDRAYQAWVMPIQPSIGPTVTPDAVVASCYKFLEGLRKTPEVMSWDSLSDFARENMSVLGTGLDSVWLILRSNMTLLLGILSTTFSLLFDGGISVVNFILHSVVFLTALFYLLSTSRVLYRPVEMITQMSPKYGSQLALAVELSCREVLAASAKLSVFYGLWTWLIHTIFQSNFVYMPSIFAATLGVVPVLGTYWACLAGILDIWLVQESRIRAFGLFLAQVLPTIIIDNTIYDEIKGSGHPYLTGLSIAGGMLWLGLDGVVVGPLLLCFLFTILKVLSGLQDDD